MDNTKVYRYRRTPVIKKVQQALKQRKRESTVADLILATGLPDYQVRESVQSLSAEFNGHLKATESGELLYYFPEGFRNPSKTLGGRIKRTGAKIGRALYKAFSLLFKGWIMVMLVGYFALFIGLIILSIVASIAMTFAGNSSDNRGRRGGGFMSFYLTIRLVELLLSFWTLRSFDHFGQRKPKKRKKRTRPLYQTIFAFVFGDNDPGERWEESRKLRALNFIRNNKGVITQEELSGLNGDSLSDSNSKLSRMAIEYNGEPRVSDDGTVYYFFPDLLRTTDTGLPGSLAMRDIRPEIPFNNNTPKENKWIGFINGFNIVLGGYFLVYTYFLTEALAASSISIVYRYAYGFLRNLLGTQASLGILGIGLGMIPLAFSVLFYLVPLLRNLRRKRRNSKIHKAGLKQKIFNHLYKNARNANPERAVIDAGYVPSEETLKLAEHCFDEAGRYTETQIEETSSGARIWSFPDFSRSREDMVKVRQTINPDDYETGGTVFDSGSIN